MIRALFLLIVSFISITTFGQKPFKYAGRGIQMTEMWADSVARIPSDTVRNKTGIARIGVRFFVGNGTFWTEIAGGSGTGANIYNTSGQITGSRIVDINGNTLTFTNGGAPADMLFDNGTQFIEMSTTHDWVNIFNGHTSLKVIDGINVNMVNTGTASMRTDSLPQNQQRIYQFPNRAGTIALTSDTAGLRELIGGKVDSVTFTSSTCVDTINVYRAGVKTQKTFDKVNGLLSGGEVTPGANDTTFNVAAAVYNAQCVRYTSDATPITLNGNSDSAKGRIDVIYTQAGNVGAIQGQNLTNPIAPALTASQIGLATVTFYPFADTGVVNIYNTTNVNVIDSSAIRSVAVTADSSAFIFTSLRRVDTIYTSRSTAIDSLRRLAGSTNVQARKGGIWITQFTDSVGSGSSSDSLDVVVQRGNTLLRDIRIFSPNGIDTVFVRDSTVHRISFASNTANNTQKAKLISRIQTEKYNTLDPAGKKQGRWSRYAISNNYNGGGSATHRQGLIFTEGYNISPGGSEDLVGEGYFQTSLETDFGRKFEWYHQVGVDQPSRGHLDTRPLMFVGNKDTLLSEWAFRTTFVHAGPIDTAMDYFNTQNGQLTIDNVPGRTSPSTGNTTLRFQISGLNSSISFNGTSLIFGGAQLFSFSNPVAPILNNTYDLGNQSVRWRKGFIQALQTSMTVAPDANYTQLISDETISFKNITASRQLTLVNTFTGNTFVTGTQLTVVTGQASFAVTFAGTTVKNIDGTTATSLPAGKSCVLKYDGTNWQVVSVSSGTL